MSLTIADLKKGESAVITDSSSNDIPLKLLEMGCLPGNEVKLLQLAPFSDPMYLNVNDSFLAIRKETASLIVIEKINE
ncbi:iron transporter [Formosa sp. Hel3_A1_48]|uniref:FeoA family protein n=1 Tax=Formosa sp. Hel3_A1_48 TaxID=1336795 RepID=UPI00084E314B|nr:FeoA family protein [Formosa sp. Hel3_A1_48]MBT7704255.1 ferrous iron transport protein A [Polaribacter sp.]MDA9761002.1 ferrous iron transport protein A [Flavobacteriaceae bacterium]NCF41737.1 ferrous iron transport protein A [Bacteroidota bacterium]AOR26463.1 iron transporter [Formosa sp. Hel3_A1_48]MDC0950888.1 FeoA family protein [Flavobacteriaceae bacterium]